MKIGIITMHKVRNFGSALQAFALLRVLSNMGHDVELIDYEFKKDNDMHLRQLLLFFICYVRDAIRHNPEKKQEKKFQEFYFQYYKCSDHRYISEKMLIDTPPQYDCVITGSDQVWNPIHIDDDKSFLLSFVSDDIIKISYASSFSTARLPEKYHEEFKRYLSRYNSISVREKSGQMIVKELLGFEPKLVCDPTLLLKKCQWLEMIGSKHPNEGKPYILVYILKYAYNPFPYVNDIIDNVAQKLGYSVISINSPHGIDTKSQRKDLRGLGPLDFLNLFANASFVITTSFHGTAFAINFQKDFISVVSDNQEFDTRMMDLLRIVGAEDRAVIYNNPGEYSLKIDYDSINERLEEYRDESTDYLVKALSNN